MEVAVPPENESESIVKKLKANEINCAVEMSNLGKLRLLKQGLMDDLLTGRVRVTPLLEESTDP